MTPEKLKELAEALGKKIRVQHSGRLFYDCGIFNSSREFNPEYNPAQREQVLLWLLGKGWNIGKTQMDSKTIEYIFHPPVWWELDKWNPIIHESYTTALMMAAERELG